MNLLWLVLSLALAGFIFAKLEPFLVMPALALVALFVNRDKTLLFYLAATIGWLWQIYVLLAWCLFALQLTRLYSTRPTVEHHWLYYIIGFMGCLSPVSFMMSFESPDNAVTEFKQTAIFLLASAGFIGFALVPWLALPWVWILRFV